MLREYRFSGRRSRLFRLAVLLVLSLPGGSCREDDDFSTPPYLQNDLLISANDHLAFPDLAWFNNAWYLAYRVSDSHVMGTFNRIVVCRSVDFDNWEEINSFEYGGFDLRDPKFSLNEQTDSLYLHIHAASEEGIYGAQRKNLLVRFNKEQNRFASGIHSNLRLPAGYQNDWLWRPVWHKGMCIAGGYSDGHLRFYKYQSFDTEPVIFSSLSEHRPSESTIKFEGERMFTLVRREGDSWFGVSPDSVYKNLSAQIPAVDLGWTSLPFSYLRGPNMVIQNGKAYIGGRNNDDRTAIIIYSIADNRIEQVDELYSYGDNSYPGMVLRDNKIYGVYYTQSKKGKSFQIRKFIYSINLLPGNIQKISDH